MAGWAAIGWVDAALLAVLAVSVGVGLVRGVVFELLSLAGWLVAWFAALWGAPQLAPLLPLGAPGSALNHGAAFGLAFLATLVVWSLLARLVRLLVHATPLSAIDRLLGAGFGLLRGVLLLLALATVVSLTPAAQSGGWRASTGVGWLGTGVQVLKPWLPPQAVQWLPA